MPASVQDRLPPSERQRQAIKDLCFRNGINQALEDQVTDRGSAGRLIRELAKYGKPITEVKEHGN